jgi:hypothetical protein
MLRHVLASFVATATWAFLLAICALCLAWGGDVTERTNEPRDLERLPPGATHWTRLGYPGPVQMLTRVTELSDGRVAVSDIVHIDDGAFAPEPCQVWNPATGSWSNGVEIVPERFGPTGPLPNDARRLSLGDGHALIVTERADACPIEFAPPQETLPPLAPCRRTLAAARLSSGALVVVSDDPQHRRFAQRLDRGASAWHELPAPPVEATLESLRAGHDDEALLLGLQGRLARLSHDRWIELPPITPARWVHDAIVLRDGSVVVAGGALEEPRVRLVARPAITKLVAGLVALGLVALAILSFRHRPRPHLVGVVAGMLWSWGCVPWLVAQLGSGLAWH